MTVTGVNADPATRTVSVSAAAVLQPISAEVLQGFVSVYTAYVEGGTNSDREAVAGSHCAKQTAKKPKQPR